MRADAESLESGALVPSSVSIERVGPEELEVIDSRIGNLLRIVAFDEEAPPAEEVQSPATLIAVSSLIQRFPDLQAVVKDSRTLRVVFSPEIRRALATGQYRLMEVGSDSLPTAVDATGRIVGTARVVPGSLTAAGGTIAIGATAAAAWPILLAGGVGLAAAYAEQRWLEKTFADLQSAVERIEHRLRDDDAGTLDAANHLADVLRPTVTGGEVAPQLKLELAAARWEVERIYYSRSRFVDRFTRQLEAAQTEAESKGDKETWAGDIAQELRDRKSGVFDELVLFVQAMITRGRLTACTAAIVAAEGNGESAVRLLDALEPEIREDYYGLYRKVHALAKHGPRQGWTSRVLDTVRDRVPLLGSGSAEDGKRWMAWLDEQMEASIGKRFDTPEEELAVAVPSSLVVDKVA